MVNIDVGTEATFAASFVNGRFVSLLFSGIKILKTLVEKKNEFLLC